MVIQLKLTKMIPLSQFDHEQDMEKGTRQKPYSVSSNRKLQNEGLDPAINDTTQNLVYCDNN